MTFRTRPIGWGTIALFGGATASFTVGQITTGLAPFLLSAAMGQAKVDAGRASFLISAEFGSFLVAAVVVASTRWLNTRALAVLGCLAYAAAAFLSAGADGYTALAIFRVISGLGGGLVFAAGTRAMASHDAFEGLIAAAVVGSTVVGCMLLVILPTLMSEGGPGAIYQCVGLVALVAAPCCFGLSLGDRLRATSGSAFGVSGWVLLIGYALSRLNDAIIWPFSEQVGQRSGLDGAQIGIVLAAAALLALGAPWLGLRAKTSRSLLLMLAGVMILKSFTALQTIVSPNGPAFVVAQIVAIFGTVLALQLALTRFSALDGAGRLAIFGGIAGMMADATGPALGGFTFAAYDLLGVAFLAWLIGLLGAGAIAWLVLQSHGDVRSWTASGPR
ncbi:hypothetical protein LC593_33870 [Nostoc sp. CHAB 5844]|nr:hypothetical protein [Nostoc sp. CHAB 5844]